jgi:hypothetical protein
MGRQMRRWVEECDDDLLRHLCRYAPMVQLKYVSLWKACSTGQSYHHRERC